MTSSDGIGTPLQNNIGELFALLQFLEPDKFPELEDLEKEFADLSDGEKVSQLHKMLHEYILRRTKNDVETPVPPKVFPATPEIQISNLTHAGRICRVGGTITSAETMVQSSIDKELWSFKFES